MITLTEWCIANNHQEILNKWSENNTISPDNVSYGSIKVVKWVCDKGHTWETSVNKMTSRASLGCPYCASQKVWRGYNDLQTKDPEVATEWHPTKNKNLYPYEVTVSSNKLIWWLCPLGHEYEAMVSSRTRASRKRGCPYCANKRLLRGFNDLESVCPEVATEWHPTKNGELKPSDVFSSSSQVIWWRCPKGHDYQATLNSRIQKGKQYTGCPICSNKVVLKGYNDLETLYPEIAKEWDNIKNGNVLPCMVIPGSHTKYWWLCPFGHSYKASPENRTKAHGTGCPICANEQQSSFPEQAIFYYLKQQFPLAQNRALIDGKEIDIYIPEEKIGIEYDGKRWHTLEIREKEKLKDNFFLDKGIRIIRVKEYIKTEEIDDLPDTIWINERKNKYRNIEYALQEIIAHLNCKNVNFTVDLENDNVNIMKMYVTSRKANSLAVLRPDIANEWNSEKNGVVSPEQVTVSSGKKFWWICSLGHEYQMSVDSRTHGSKCPYCTGKRLLKGFNDLETRYPQIAAEWHLVKNDDLSPSDVLPGTLKKVWWKCSNNHEYYTSISSRTNCKSGCPYCSGYKVIKGKTDLKTLYPEIAKEWDYEKNHELTPDSVKPFSHKKVWWKCINGHSYERAISDRISNIKTGKGNGCPYCSGKKTLKGFNDLATRFPEVAKKWHPIMNGELKPDMVQSYSRKKVWWIEDDGNAKFRRLDSVVSGYVKNKKKSN